MMPESIGNTDLSRRDFNKRLWWFSVLASLFGSPQVLAQSLSERERLELEVSNSVVLPFIQDLGFFERLVRESAGVDVVDLQELAEQITSRFRINSANDTYAGPFEVEQPNNYLLDYTGHIREIIVSLNFAEQPVDFEQQVQMAQAYVNEINFDLEHATIELEEAQTFFMQMATKFPVAVLSLPLRIDLNGVTMLGGVSASHEALTFVHSDLGIPWTDPKVFLELTLILAHEGEHYIAKPENWHRIAAAVTQQELISYTFFYLKLVANILDSILDFVGNTSISVDAIRYLGNLLDIYPFYEGGNVEALIEQFDDGVLASVEHIILYHYGELDSVIDMEFFEEWSRKAIRYRDEFGKDDNYPEVYLIFYCWKSICKVVMTYLSH